MIRVSRTADRSIVVAIGWFRDLHGSGKPRGSGGLRGSLPVGVPILDAAGHGALRAAGGAASSFPNPFPNTYGEWQRLVAEMEHGHAWRGRLTRRVSVDPVAFLAWCRARRSEPDVASLVRHATLLAMRDAAARFERDDASRDDASRDDDRLPVG